MRIILFLIILLSLPFAANARAQVDTVIAAFDRGCSDNRGNDRCDPEYHSIMRKLYGIESAKTLKSRKLDVRRVYIINGYGRDVIAVTFLRKEDGTAWVEILSPAWDLLKVQPRKLIGTLSPSDWKKVVELTSLADNASGSKVSIALALANIEEQTNDSEKPITLCIHGWGAVFETASGDFYAGSCKDEEGVTKAFDTLPIARAVLPECTGFQLDEFRNMASLLAECQLLGGDRYIAFEAWTLANAINQIDRQDVTRDAVASFFADKSSIAIDQLFNLYQQNDIYVFPPYGEAADKASASGQASAYSDDGESYEYNEISFEFIKKDGAFLIESMTYEERKTIRLDEDSE